MSQQFPEPPGSVSGTLTNSISSVTPPPTNFAVIPLLTSTPTESLRSSVTAKRMSIVSLDPNFDLVPDYHLPEGKDRGRDSRIEKWLEQQCGGFVTWENTDETRLSDEDLQVSLRHRRSSRILATTSLSTTTRATSATSSFESDPLLPLPSPTTAASSCPPEPSSPGPTQNKFLMPPPNSNIPRARDDDPEAARADSPLLGSPGLAVDSGVMAPSPVGILGTINDDEERAFDIHRPARVGRSPLSTFADVDKPLPNPPSFPPSLPKAIAAVSVTADRTALIEQSQIAASGPASHPEARPLHHTGSRLGLKHSPTPSNASTSSSSHRSYHNSHHHLRSQTNSHSTAAHLPIGVVHAHAHSRTSSGNSNSPYALASSSNGVPSVSGASINHAISRRMSRTSSITPGAGVSMATLAPSSTKIEVPTSLARRPSLLLQQKVPILLLGQVEGTQEIRSDEREERSLDSSGSTAPVSSVSSDTVRPMASASYVALASYTRNRSHSNAIPTSSLVQFHLPTGMLHRSQSHAQLRIGGNGVMPPFSQQVSPGLVSRPTINSPLASSSSLASATSSSVAVPRHSRKQSGMSPKGTSPAMSRTHSHSPSYASTTSAAFEELQGIEDERDPLRQAKVRRIPRSQSQVNLHSHSRQASQILDSLESRVPSLSSASRNAVYIDSEDVNMRLDELLLMAKEEMERQTLEEDEEDGSDEKGEYSGETAGGRNPMEGGDRNEVEQWADRRSRRSVDLQLVSPPNTPAMGLFGFLPATGSAPEIAKTTDINAEFGAGDFYASPEASSSQVYLGNNPTSQINPKESLGGNEVPASAEVVARKPPAPLRPPPAPPLDMTSLAIGVDRVVDLPPPTVEIVESSSQEGEIRPSRQVYTHSVHVESEDEDEELMDEALAFARELAVGDRIVWGGRRSLEMYDDDCWSDFEDEELGVGILGADGLPRMNPAPYGGYYAGEGSVRGVKVTEDGEAHVQFLFDDEEGRDGTSRGLAPPSMSKWSLTSSIDDEKRLPGETKKKKKRRSFVPFVISGDKEKDKDDESSYKDVGSVSKKRNRLASFISRLSSVGLGGSGYNTPSSSARTPPVPLTSASSSSHTLPSLLPSPVIATKWDSPSIPTLVPGFVGLRSRSPSPRLDSQLQSQSTLATDPDVGPNSHLAPPIGPINFPVAGSPNASIRSTKPTLKTVTSSPSIRIPPGIVIPPLPKHPPPTTVPVATPLGKAASEGLVNGGNTNLQPVPPLIRGRANSTADLIAKKLASLNSTFLSKNHSQTLPAPISRRPALTKSASASVLGLHQQLMPFSAFAGADLASAYYCYDVPPTPTSIASTEEYGDVQGRDSSYNDSQRSRLNGMLSSVNLPSSSIVQPAPSKSKGGLKAIVGRWTGRGKNAQKTKNVEQNSPAVPESALHSTNDQRSSVQDDPEPSTPVAEESCKTPIPPHSPTGLLSSGTNSNVVTASPYLGGGGGIP